MDSSGDKYVWSRTGVGNDYTYQKLGDSGGVAESGPLRVMNIRDDIYVVQTRNERDSDDAYEVNFFSITADSISPVDISTDDAELADQIARQHNVQGKENISAMNSKIAVVVADYVDGSPSDILGFLKGLRAVRFKPSS